MLALVIQEASKFPSWFLHMSM